jgi:hypothetical protein
MSRRFFLSYVRQGASAGIMGVDSLRGAIARPPEVVPRLLVERDGVPLAPIEGPPIRVMDPGDVIGINRSAVTRQYPEPGSTNGPPNELAYVEFSRPDMPWMFTPASATPEQRLRPWIVLVVVPLQAEIPGNRPASFPRVAVSELPDLKDSHAWAHAQVMAADANDIPRAIERHAAGTVSRLICPRKLEPFTAYRASVVPTFDATLNPSWDVDRGGTVELRTYLDWTFHTGPKGDFEELVRLLQPIESTSGLGTRAVSANRPWPTFKTLRALAGTPDDTTPAVSQQDGALAVPGQDARPSLDNACATAFRTRMAEHLNQPFAGAEAEEPPPDDPREIPASQGTSLAPPMYGAHHANVQEIDPAASGWVQDLNLDPRRRAAAAMGTRYVQENQEFLMARAWEQLRDIEQANRLRRIAELSSVSADALHRRSVATLTPSEVLGLAAPARTRVRRGAATLSAEVHKSTLPAALATPAFGRLARRSGPIARRMFSARSSMLVERSLTGEERVLPRPVTTAAPLVSLIRQTEPGSADITNRRAAMFRRLVGAGEEVKFAEGLAAAKHAVDDAERAAVGGLIFPAALAPARDAIRGVLAGSDLASGLVGPLRVLFDDPQQVQAAAGVIGVVSAFINQRVIEPAVPIPRPGVAVNPGDLRDDLVAALRPSDHLARRLADRISVPFPKPDDPLARVMTHPEFPAPLAMALLQTWPNAVLPGLESFPINRVALLETNPAFTAAFLVGANHEMNREFLWREFPTDQRGTPFKHFWPRPPAAGSDGREIDAIVRWPTGRPLAANLAAGRGAETVLLVRGDVLRRFPKMIVMAAPATNPAGAVGPFDSWLLPTFPIPFPNDSMAYVFQLDVVRALGSPGWFFVFQEPITVPRYGFDVTRSGPPTTWNDLAWGDVHLSRGMFVDVARGPDVGVPDARGATWGASAADMATVTYQRPFRLLFHARALFNV